MCNYKIYDLRVGKDRVTLIDNGGIDTKLRFEDVRFAHNRRELFKHLSAIGRDLYDGTIMFADSSKCSAKKVYDKCKSRHGSRREHEKNASKYRERFACEFARRMCA